MSISILVYAHRCHFAWCIFYRCLSMFPPQRSKFSFGNVVARQISVEFNLPIRAIDTIFRPFACNDRLHCFYDAAAGKVNWWFRINLHTDFINLPMIVNTILTAFQIEDSLPVFPAIALTCRWDIYLIALL